MFAKSCEASRVLEFFKTIDKDMISITKKIFAETQICDLKFSQTSCNFSLSKACLIDWKWKAILLKLRNDSNCILIFDMLKNCRESIDMDAEPSFTIHELPYRSICMVTMRAVITSDPRWTVVTCFIQKTWIISDSATAWREWEYLLTVQD